MKRAARLLRIANELRIESTHQRSALTRAELHRAAEQLVRLASKADVISPDRADQLDAFEEAATNLLVSLMSDRAFYALARGVIR